MTSQKRRAAGRRRAWGRGPVILRFEALEGRQLLTAAPAAPAQPLPDLVGAVFATSHSLDWGDSFHAVGTILNQGKGTANDAFNVEVYASTTPTLDSTAVPLGEVSIPAGLGPNQSSKFDQVFSLPPTPIPNYSAGNPIYIALQVDPEKKIAESNDRNNQGIGNGNDISPVTITPQQPSLLIGSSLGVSPTTATWGQTITVTAQIRNNAQGAAPPTRTRLVLTPAGLNPGSAYDVTIGYINLPVVPAWQTVNAVQQVTLPAVAPTSLAGGSQFTLSMVQDADFVTDPLSPHVVDQGPGLDSTPIAISYSPGSAPQTPTALPDLAPSNVVEAAKSIYWGYSFQVSATVQNLGTVDSGPVDVRFLLTGTDGSLDHAIFLGQTTISGLAANTSQDISQTLQLPNRLPSGVSLPSTGLGRIAVVVDPDHVHDESLRSNNVAASSPVTFRVLGTDGTSKVPTSPPVGTTLGQPRPAGTIQSPTATAPAPAASASAPLGPKAAARAARLAAAQARVAARAGRPGHPRKLHRKAVPPKEDLGTKIERQLKVFPDKVKNFVNDLFNTGSDNNTTTKKKSK